MSSDSDDTEEFYDAEDKLSTKLHTQTLTLTILQTNAREKPKAEDENNDGEKKAWEPIPSPLTSEEIAEAERKALDQKIRHKKVEERRRKMLLTDEEEIEITSDMSSKASSTDGVFMVRSSSSSRNSPDCRSEGDLSRVGSLLRGEGLPLKLAEPDLVADCTKSENRGPEAPPKPPPRQRKPKAPQHPKPPPQSVPVQGLPSPTSAVNSFVQELEHSLDLRSAVRGEYVVKPQDNERDRAPLAENETKEMTLSSSPRKESLAGDQMQPPRRGSSISPADSFEHQNFMMRTRSDSGRPLTDLEILEQVMVLNLDTGEQVPLSLAEERLPRGINPLSLHIMRLTSEYVSNSSLDKLSEEETSKKSDSADAGGKFKRRIAFKKMLERTVERTVNKIKTVRDEVYHARHSEDQELSEDESTPDDVRSFLKIKGSNSHKGPPYDFDGVKVLQELTGEHSGAIWTMKFSSCGRLLASAGQDHVLRIWILRSAFDYFNDMRQKYNAEAKVSPTPSQESLASGHLSNDDLNKLAAEGSEEVGEGGIKGPFMKFCTYEGHTADLLDVSWSKNYFILSSSMDKTVRLWHISRKECLCCFQHIDFVTAIAFHPRDDRYFLSGSLDGKLRMWNIPDKKVALWNELDGQTKLITAANFCQNGKFAVIGSYDGRCIFYSTEQLKYYTQLNVRSTRGKNKQGRKISGIEPMPGEDKILVTSNDSRIRLYDLRDLSLTCKYKGYVNLSSQIRASFSHDGKYIVSGSENQFIYLWRRQHKVTSGRRDRNDYWEGIKAHNAVVTAAVFAPNPSLVLQQLDQSANEADPGYVFVSADFSGAIRVFAKKPKSKAS